MFVGNSYTYYNSLPSMVEAMAEAVFPGHRVETKFVGGGGATLKNHWEAGKALQAIETGRWDYVVLQEQSMLGAAIVDGGERYFGSPEPFFHYARLFDQAIKERGAETVFYMTWSRQGHRSQQKYLTYAYMTIARELGSTVAPVGLVWDQVRENGQIDLYQDDGSHPSVHGSFLAATTLVAIIFDAMPPAIPGYLEGYEILRGGRLAAQKSLLCRLSDAEAAFIRDATAAVFERLKRNNGYLDVEAALSERDPPPLPFRLLRELGTAEGQAVALIAVLGIYLIVRGGIKWARSL